MLYDTLDIIIPTFMAGNIPTHGRTPYQKGSLHECIEDKGLVFHHNVIMLCDFCYMYLVIHLDIISPHYRGNMHPLYSSNIEAEGQPEVNSPSDTHILWQADYGLT